MKLPSPTMSRTALLLLSLNVQFFRINSFTPSLDVHRAATRLHSVAAPSVDKLQDLAVGTVVTKRYLHRLSPSQSAVQSPYTIEERQKYSVAPDRSLMPLGDKALVFREEDKSVAEEGYIGIGPSLYAVDGLELARGPSTTDWGSVYAMVLYCMKYPEIISGKGLEVGR